MNPEESYCDSFLVTAAAQGQEWQEVAKVSQEHGMAAEEQLVRPRSGQSWANLKKVAPVSVANYAFSTGVTALGKPAILVAASVCSVN